MPCDFKEGDSINWSSCTRLPTITNFAWAFYYNFNFCFNIRLFLNINLLFSIKIYIINYFLIVLKLLLFFFKGLLVNVVVAIHNHFPFIYERENWCWLLGKNPWYPISIVIVPLIWVLKWGELHFTYVEDRWWFLFLVYHGCFYKRT